MTPLQQHLDALVEQYNEPGFIEKDPVQFPHRFHDVRDIEISALLTSTIAWGRRPMILANANKLHSILENEPYHFVLEGDIESIPEGNIHRTFFARHLRHALRGLRLIYQRYGSLQDLAVACGAVSDNAPAWVLARAINEAFAEANCSTPLEGPSRCIPEKPDTSALKRLNMALRWLVRKDGIVDLGVWDSITPAQLYIPLDVHVANTARALGLLTRRANDRRAVEELTSALRAFRPEDPTAYDFALFTPAALQTIS